MVARASRNRGVERAARRVFAETWFFFRGARVLVRPTIGLLACAAGGATVLHVLGGTGAQPPPGWPEAFFAAWFILLGELPVALPSHPLAAGVVYLLPLLGVLFLAEGVIKLGFTVFRKAENQEAWMSILARSQRSHIILCGLGTVGFRILQELVGLGEQVFVIERSGASAFLDRARELGAEIVVGDARTENLIRSLNVERAHAVIIATDDDLTNLEIAMDIREMKVAVPIVMRLFDHRLAAKVRHTLGIQVTLSTSQLAAPLFAAAALDPGVVGTHRVGGEIMVVVELEVNPAGRIANRTVAQLHGEHGISVVAMRDLDGTWQVQPSADTVIGPCTLTQFMLPGQRAGRVRELNAG